jgi:hypothetical protein
MHLSLIKFSSQTIARVPIEAQHPRNATIYLQGTIKRYDAASPRVDIENALERWGERGISLPPLEETYRDLRRDTLSRGDALYLLEADLHGKPTVIGAACTSDENYYHRDKVTLNGLQAYPAPLHEAGYTFKVPPLNSPNKKHGPGIGRGLTWAIVLDTLKRTGYWHFPAFHIHSLTSAGSFYRDLFKGIPISPGVSPLDMSLNRDTAIAFLERVSQRKGFRHLGLHKVVRHLRQDAGITGKPRKVPRRLRKPKTCS